MEFLKSLFGEGEALTFEQFTEKARNAKLNIVNIADGSYISRAKHDDKVNALNQQITDLSGQITQRDTDMKDLQGKLTAAQADASKLGDAQTALTALQSKYDTDKQEYEQKLQKQSYDFLVREKANSLNFTSPAAKRDFIREVTDKGLKIDGENLLGYDDFVTKYKADNPGAMAEEKPTEPPTPPAPTPSIVLPGTQPTPGEKSLFGFQFNGVRPKAED